MSTLHKIGELDYFENDWTEETIIKWLLGAGLQITFPLKTLSSSHYSAYNNKYCDPNHQLYKNVKESGIE